MGLISCHAWCVDCGKVWEARNSMGVAAMHHHKTGHKTMVESTYCKIFETPVSPIKEG